MKLGAFPKKAAIAASNYLRRHPEEVLRAARHLTTLKLGLPLPALRWLAVELGGERLPSDFFIEAREGGLFVRGSIELMHTPLLASATVVVERVEANTDALVVVLRVMGLQLEVTDPAVATPISALLRSGSLDVSRPGDLLSYMPKPSPVVVEAKGDRFTLDLMKHPASARHSVRRVLAMLVPLVSIEAIETDDEHLDVSLRALPMGAGEAAQQLWKLF